MLLSSVHPEFDSLLSMFRRVLFAEMLLYTAPVEGYQSK